MSWPAWPTAGIAPPTVVQGPVINSASSVANATAAASMVAQAQYTPEQWAQVQQHNWQQWAQWQQQFQQWQQQYGAEYQKSMSAMAQASGAAGPAAAYYSIAGVAPASTQPPLPVDSKPPLPPDEPQASQGQQASAVQQYAQQPPLPQATQGTSVASLYASSSYAQPPLPGATGYSTAPPLPKAAPPKDQYQYNQQTSKSQDNFDNRNATDENQKFNRNQGFSGNNSNWQNQGNRHQGAKGDYGVKRGYNQQYNERGDNKRNKMDNQQEGNKWQGGNQKSQRWNDSGDNQRFEQGRNQRFDSGGNQRFDAGNNQRFDAGGNQRFNTGSNQRLDSGGNQRLDSGGNQRNQRWGEPTSSDKFSQGQEESNQRNQQPGVDNRQQLKSTPKLNPDEPSEAEKKFDKQFAEWEAQFQKWKAQNLHHPDKSQYQQYEKKWVTWRAQLLERREQMRRKRLGLTADTAKPAQGKSLLGSSPADSSCIENQRDNIMSETRQQYHSDKTVDAPLVLPQKPMLDSSQELTKFEPESTETEPSLPITAESTNTELETENTQAEQHIGEENTEMVENSAEFIKTTTASGIPGLDLVKEGESKPEDAEETPSEQEQQKKPDLEAISRGINSILGDQKLMNMLSIVSQKPPGISTNNTQNVLTSTNTDLPKYSPTDYGAKPENEEFSNQGNIDDRSQTSFNINESENFNRINEGDNASFNCQNFNTDSEVHQQEFVDSVNEARGPRGYNDPNQSDSFNKPRGFNQGFGNFNLGPNANRNSGNWGQDNFNRDQPNFNRNSERPLESPNLNKGPPSLLSLDFSKGLGNFNRGPGNFGRGNSFDRKPEFNRDWESEQPEEYNDEEYDNEEFDNYQSSSSGFNNRGTENMGGPERFNRGGPGNLNKGGNAQFNRGRPDQFNRGGPANFNKGGQGNNRQDFNNFNRSGMDFLGDDGEDDFPPDEEDDFNRGGFNNFNRSNTNFNRGGFDNSNRGRDDFNRGHDDFKRGPADDLSKDRFNRGGEKFFLGKDNPQGQENFNRLANDFDRGPETFTSGMNLGKAGVDSIGREPNNFLENKFDGGPNIEPLIKFEPPNHQFQQKIPIDVNAPPKQEEQNQEEIWKPTTVVDYEHKPLKPAEPDILLVPLNMYDYRHKLLSRIPFPQRPKWLSDMIRNIPEFDVAVTRQFEANQLVRPQDSFRDQKPLSSWDRKVLEERDRDRKSFDDRDRKGFDNRDWSFDDRNKRYEDRDRKSFEERDQKSFEYRDRKSFDDRDRKPFEDRDRKPFEDRDRKSLDDRDRRSHDERDRKSFGDRERKSFNDRERKYLEDRDRKDRRKFDDRDRSRSDDQKSYGQDDSGIKSSDDKLEELSDSGFRKPNKDQFQEPEVLFKNVDNWDQKNVDATKTDSKPAKAKNVTSVEDILCSPGRFNRPPRIVIILRGPPGSGKSHLAKLIKDKEVENGGSAPRIICLDDYFMVEQDKEVEEDGKKINVKEMVYEYEECMEASYRQSLMKSFKKTITDGYFTFIIVDNVNDKVKYFGEMWSFAKQNGFQVYICQMDLDVKACTKRNIHGRSEIEIERCVASWEPTPNHHPLLDASTLLQTDDITEVEMEEEDSPARFESAEENITSKWDTFDYSVDNLAKLDGTNKPLRPSATMEDYLQLDEWTEPVPTKPGQKRVRWADLEQHKKQEKMRAIGFVVGHTNWDQMMDPTKGSSALTQTKYIDRY